jgi:transcriptional regulator with XRE-family HTH domain
MFSYKLKESRKRNKLTQVALAEILGVSKGTVAMWETDKRYPRFEMLTKLARTLHVNPAYLLGTSLNPFVESRKKGSDLAQAMTSFVNGSGKDDYKDFCQTMVSEHRTLQQLSMKLMVQMVRTWADTPYYDARNEDTVLMCKRLVKAIDEDPHLSYI